MHATRTTERGGAHTTKPLPSCIKSVRMINKSGIFFFLAARFGERARTSLLKAKKIIKNQISSTASPHTTVAEAEVAGGCLYVIPSPLPRGVCQRPREGRLLPSSPSNSTDVARVRSSVDSSQQTPGTAASTVYPPEPPDLRSALLVVVLFFVFFLELLTAATFFCRSQTANRC